MKAQFKVFPIRPFLAVAILLAAVMTVYGEAQSQTAANTVLDDLELRGGLETSETEPGDDGETVQNRPSRTIGIPTRNLTNQRVRRVQPQGPVGTDSASVTSSTTANVAQSPVQQGARPVTEDDPFAQTGLRLGSMNVLMSLEQTAGYSSNISGQVDGAAGAFSQTDVDASITSDWSRHQLQTNISASYRRPFNDEATDDIEGSIDTSLRLDLIDGYTLTGGLNYAATTQEFTDTTLAPGAVDTPLEQTYGGSLELNRTGQKLRLRLRGAITRNTFEDADLGGGVTASQEDQNNNLYSLSLRTGYEISPAIAPFVEGIYSVRDYDLLTDRNGNQRDSTGYEGRLGVEVDLGEKLTGEFAAGYLVNQFEDPQLEDLTGLTLNGTLNWSPERDTNVALTIATSTNNSITAGENGDFSYEGRIEVDRQVTDRLSVDAFTGLTIETNDNRNQTLEIGVGTQYWLNRFLAVTADVEYQRFTSDAANSTFDELSGRVGVRLQR